MRHDTKVELIWELALNQVAVHWISHQNLNFQILFSHGFCHQNAFKQGLWVNWTSLNSYVIILKVSFKQNLNLKIQILAGNTMNSWFNADSQISSTLVNTLEESWTAMPVGNNICFCYDGIIGKLFSYMYLSFSNRSPIIFSPILIS